MEGPLAILMEEHRRIEKILAALDAYATRALGGIEVKRQELADLVLVVREYADARHHGKEEGILFDLLCAHGFPRDRGPVAVMLHEHAEGRAFVSRLADIAAGKGPLGPDERERLADAARSFCLLMRQHIQKEDQVLYPMAAAKLDADTMVEMGMRFERADAAHDAAERWPEVRALLERIT